ncbi:hypothetical protein RRG08_026453 [Elysia crispata]|uniref:Uncharacterized protein n=1 Tax=Elysia crispata TaxID=231223 RepID=A0AAE0Y460_9GAST|nr:hypothetical protein RRG08_026453 [Elysia crispata]
MAARNASISREVSQTLLSSNSNLTLIRVNKLNGWTSARILGNTLKVHGMAFGSLVLRRFWIRFCTGRCLLWTQLHPS